MNKHRQRALKMWKDRHKRIAAQRVSIDEADAARIAYYHRFLDVFTYKGKMYRKGK